MAAITVSRFIIRSLPDFQNQRELDGFAIRFLVPSSFSFRREVTLKSSGHNPRSSETRARLRADLDCAQKSRESAEARPESSSNDGSFRAFAVHSSGRIYSSLSGQRRVVDHLEYSVNAAAITNRSL
jgi:hypothetical protein